MRGIGTLAPQTAGALLLLDQGLVLIIISFADLFDTAKHVPARPATIIPPATHGKRSMEGVSAQSA
jgi:hypothetical protein